MSEAKRLVVKGRSFQQFLDFVVPLLDGRHTTEEIQEQLAGVFDPEDIAESITLLIENRVVIDAEMITLSPDIHARLEPSLGYLLEVGYDPSLTLDRLAGARLTVLGLGGPGAVAATALAAAGVGNIRCVERAAVTVADPHLTQLFRLDEVGRPRLEAVRDRIGSVSPTTSVELIGEELVTDEDVAGAVAGSDFVLGCVDPGLSSITYKLNRVCLEHGIAWCAATVSAFEGIVGPTVLPFETACYLCYQMRSVAASEDPEGALADLRQQDERKVDTSSFRENLAFGAGIVGNLAALEVFQALAGARPATAGRILRVNLAHPGTSWHVVLRKPWCPACFRTRGD